MLAGLIGARQGKEGSTDERNNAEEVAPLPNDAREDRGREVKIEYERVATEITIKPMGEPIFHELATKIRIDDEAAGPFLRVSQVRDDERQEITIDIESWPSLRDGIEYMMANCIAMELSADPVNRMASQEEGKR